MPEETRIAARASTIVPLPKPPSLITAMGGTNVMTRQSAEKFDMETSRWWNNVQTVFKKVDDELERLRNETLTS